MDARREDGSTPAVAWTVKSRPRYAPPRLDEGGGRHLALAGPDGARALQDWLRRDGDRAAIESHDLSAAAAAPEWLRARLVTVHMDLRLYLFGREDWLWRMARAARDAGLSRDAMHLHATGLGTRRVWCVHCRTVLEEVRATPVACPGCARHLQVRDHFSRELAAYLGVQADAETPGELPEPRSLDA